MDKQNLSFELLSQTINFKEQFFSTIADEQWNDWQWQLKNRITTKKQLESYIKLSYDEEKALNSKENLIPLSITPYYLSLIDSNNPQQPIRKSVVPVYNENIRSFGEQDDPLHEDKYSPVPGIVNRYPDRVLFLVTDFCSVYCRYCTRSRMVGHCESINSIRQWEKAIAYIESNSKIRDVLLSGGDALTLPDEMIEWLLTKLRNIPHVEFIRIGTKVPVVLPQRITDKLVNILKKFHPLWMSIHFTHPDELTKETQKACTKLADAGIPLGSQTVLLKDINDNVETLKKLYHGLLKSRVRPYYLYQCDPIPGSAHFRTSVKSGLDIIKGLRGHTTGYAVPTYVIDAPGGGGKIPIFPETIISNEDGEVLLKNYNDNIYYYPDVI